jgi:hypothetical protein
VFGERQPGDDVLPEDLTADLRQWAAVATSIAGAPVLPEQRDIVSRRGRQLAGRVSAAWGRPIEYVDPLTGGRERVQGTGPLPAVAPEPTPWETGLPVAGFFAVLAAIGDIALSRAFGEAFGLLWIPANLLVVGGLAPSLWLARRQRFWRWITYGVAVGLAVAWIVLLLGQFL